MRKTLLCICIAISALSLTACGIGTEKTQAKYTPVRPKVSRTAAKSTSGSGKRYSVIKRDGTLYISDGRNQNFSQHDSNYMIFDNGSGELVAVPKTGSQYQQENFHSMSPDTKKSVF